MASLCTHYKNKCLVDIWLLSVKIVKQSSVCRAFDCAAVLLYECCAFFPLMLKTRNLWAKHVGTVVTEYVCRFPAGVSHRHKESTLSSGALPSVWEPYTNTYTCRQNLILLSVMLFDTQQTFTDRSSSVVRETFSSSRAAGQTVSPLQSCVNFNRSETVTPLINDTRERSTSYSEHFTIHYWALYIPWLIWHWNQTWDSANPVPYSSCQIQDSRNRLLV